MFFLEDLDLPVEFLYGSLLRGKLPINLVFILLQKFVKSSDFKVVGLENLTILGFCSLCLVVLFLDLIPFVS